MTAPSGITVGGFPYHEMGPKELVVEACKLLSLHYPGWQWNVVVDAEEKGGIMYIWNLDISRRYGYVLHLDYVHDDPMMKCVVNAGGEILERAGQRRGKRRFDDEIKKVEGNKPHHQPLRLKDGVLLF